MTKPACWALFIMRPAESCLATRWWKSLLPHREHHYSIQTMLSTRQVFGPLLTSPSSKYHLHRDGAGLWTRRVRLTPFLDGSQIVMFNYAMEESSVQCHDMIFWPYCWILSNYKQISCKIQMFTDWKLEGHTVECIPLPTQFLRHYTMWHITRSGIHFRIFWRWFRVNRFKIVRDIGKISFWPFDLFVILT